MAGPPLSPPRPLTPPRPVTPRRPRGRRRRRRRRGRRGSGRDLAGGEEDRDRDCRPPLCRGDAGARLHRPTGARALLTAGTGAQPRARRAGRRPGHLVCTQLSFTLGALTLEQAKHLTAADAGALAGLTPCPPCGPGENAGRTRRHLRPAALQRRLASQMLAIEPAESQVYLADDHIAEYTGHQASRSAATRAAASPPRATTTPTSATWPDGRSRSPPASPPRCAPPCRPRSQRSPTPSQRATSPARPAGR